MMGSVTANAAHWDRIQATAHLFGQTSSPDDAWLALRGLRTLAVRLEQHRKSALAVAHWLGGRAEVGAVLHPALESCPGHAFWKRDFAGSSGLFSFSFSRTNDAGRARFIDALRHFGIGYSWGGYESLALPVDPQHCRSAKQWTERDPLVRLNIGLESAEDLIADLEQALRKL